MAPGPSPPPGPDPETGKSTGPAAFAAAVLGRVADGLLDPRILLAWLLAFVGAPFLAGLLVPLREGGGFLSRRFAGAGHLASGGRARAARTALSGLAAFGIAGAGLLLWGATAGWTILALLLIPALASPGAIGNSPEAAPRTRAVAASGLLVLALLLVLGIGPRGALVFWALGAAGGLWLLAAILAAASSGQAAGAASRAPAPHPLARAVFAAASLAPPNLVILGSGNPGRGLQALGGLLLASGLAALVGPPLLRRAFPVSRHRLALAAGLAAFSVALAALADALGWTFLPALLPILVFGIVAAAETVRTNIPEADAATGLALVAGGLLAPLAAAFGPRPVLLALAGLLLLAVPAALRHPPDTERA